MKKDFRNSKDADAKYINDGAVPFMFNAIVTTYLMLT